MSGTHLFYNRALLRDCELLGFEQSIERDESRTDVLYSRARITVASLLVSILPDTNVLPPAELNAHTSTIGLPGDVGFTEYDWTVADRLKRLQSILEEPRKDFWFAVNGTTYGNRPNGDPREAPSDNHDDKDPYRIVLAATGLTNRNIKKYQEDGVEELGNIVAYFQGKATTIERQKVLDCDNGPKPSNVSVVRIDGGRTIRVQVTIEICRPLSPEEESPSESSQPPVRDAGKVRGVISNRWSIRESVDSDWKTNFTIEGILRVADRRYKPDAMRLMTSTYLIPYAKLMHREFFVSTDGLTLAYRYSMQETGEAPPPLVVSWEGTYTEKLVDSAITYSSVNAKLVGSTTPPAGMSTQQYKVYLLKTLIKVIEHRVTINPNAAVVLPGTAPRHQLIKDLTIVESMHKPEVSASVLVQRNGEILEDDANNGSDPFGAILTRLDNNFGKSLSFPNHDPKWWPIPPAYTWDTASMDDRFGDTLGNVFDQYFQTPVSEWHGKPRGILDNVQIGNREGAPDDAPEDLVYMVEFDAPWGEEGPQYPSPSPVAKLWADNQFNGFSYIHVEAENQNHRNEGVMVLPLSKPRPTYAYGGNPNETVSVIPIHAGVQFRTYRAVCKRIGAWPKVPAPLPVITSTGVIETLVSQDVTPESPQPDKDGKTMYYTVHCTFKYAMNKVGASIRVPTDPRVKTITGSDLAAIGDLLDYGRVT